MDMIEEGVDISVWKARAIECRAKCERQRKVIAMLEKSRRQMKKHSRKLQGEINRLEAMVVLLKAGGAGLEKGATDD